MTKIVLSVCLSVVLAGGAAAGLVLAGRSREPCRSCGELTGDLAAVGEELQALREDTRGLLDEVRRLQQEPRVEIRSIPAAAAGEGEAVAVEGVPVARPEEITQYVLTALAEDRKQREAEREKEREEQRARQEVRRQEEEAMRQGPYDRYNLKINSLAKVLELSDSQAQAYYTLVTASREKLKQAREQQAPQAAAATGEGEGGAPAEGGGKGRRGRDQWKQLIDVTQTVQKEFSEQVQTLLLPAQLETYNQLSESARSFLGQGSVSAPGEGRGDRGGRAGREGFGGSFGLGGGGSRGRGGRP